MILLLLIACLPAVLFYFLHRNSKAAKSLVPPGPPGLPLIGNLHQLATANNIHVYLWQLSKKYGPIMHMKLGRVPLVVVSSAKLAKEVLRTQDLSFCNRPEQLGSQKLSYNGVDMVFTPYNDHWKEVRRITITHLLSPRKLQSFRPIRADEVGRMVKKISDTASSHQVVNLTEIAMAFASTLICRVAFGKRFHDKQGSDVPRFDELLFEAQEMMATPFLSDYIPSLGWVDKLFGLTDRLEMTYKKLDSFYQELIDEHLDPKREKKSDEENDILDVLIQLREQKSCSIDLSWDCIKALLMNIFLAGTDTTSASIVWTMTALMKTPGVMNRVQAEVKELRRHKSRVDEDDLHKLPYLRAAISEAFRLYPPAPLLVPREAREKSILEGYEIQPKTVVYLNAWAVARDPEHWENAHEFLPDRFLNTNIDIKGQDFRVLPFGGGRRVCPGMLMGLANVELAMANLIHAFDWEFPPGVVAKDVNTDARSGLTMHKKDPLLLVPKRVVF